MKQRGDRALLLLPRLRKRLAKAFMAVVGTAQAGETAGWKGNLWGRKGNHC